MRGGGGGRTNDQRPNTYLDHSHVEPCLLSQLFPDVTCGLGRGGESGLERLQLLSLDGRPRTSPLRPYRRVAAGRRAVAGAVAGGRRVGVGVGVGSASSAAGVSVRASGHTVVTVVAVPYYPRSSSSSRSSPSSAAATAGDTSAGAGAIPGHICGSQGGARGVHGRGTSVEFTVSQLLFNDRSRAVPSVLGQEMLGGGGSPSHRHSPAPHAAPVAGGVRSRGGLGGRGAAVGVVVEEGVVVVGQGAKQRVFAVVRAGVAVQREVLL